MYQPDTDFQSLDGVSSPISWLEKPLVPDRKLPFHAAVRFSLFTEPCAEYTNLTCQITVPNPSTFGRGNALPFFVVFTTTPRSASLAREIAADATISVSLIREVTVQETVLLPPTPPYSPTGSSDDLENIQAGCQECSTDPSPGTEL